MLKFLHKVVVAVYLTDLRTPDSYCKKGYNSTRKL